VRSSFGTAAIAAAFAVSLVAGGSARAIGVSAARASVGTGAGAAATDPAVRFEALRHRLVLLDRLADGGPPPVTKVELRAAVARWRAAARGFGRLGADARPGGAPSRVATALRALSQLAHWRQAQMTYAADLFSRPVPSLLGAKEGLARMGIVERGLRERLRIAIVRLQA
jgi:hypothetical protein